MFWCNVSISEGRESFNLCNSAVCPCMEHISYALLTSSLGFMCAYVRRAQGTCAWPAVEPRNSLPSDFWQLGLCYQDLGYEVTLTYSQLNLPYQSVVERLDESRQHLFIKYFSQRLLSAFRLGVVEHKPKLSQRPIRFKGISLGANENSSYKQESA